MTSRPLKKGDRVEFQRKDPAGKIETVYGVVLRRGASRVKVVIDGGEFAVTASPRAFTPSSHPLPVDTVATPMDAYSVTGYREGLHSEETTDFVATLVKAGRKFATIENDGHGGSDFVRPLRGFGHDDVVAFENDAKAWWATFASKPESGWPIEIYAVWVAWYTTGRPYGVTAAAYIREFQTDLET